MIRPRHFSVWCGSALLAALLFPGQALSAELLDPKPLGKPAMKAYRQILPDGSIVYSDKPVKGARIDETIVVEPPVDGSTWSTDPGTPPKKAPQTTTTPVNRVVSVPQPGQRPSLDDAEAEVTRAEMLLEDARRKKEAGVEPLPGERTGNVNGTTRLNEAYKARQKALAQAVEAAEARLRQSIAERDALKTTR